MLDGSELSETLVKVSEKNIQKGKLLSIDEHGIFTGCRQKSEENEIKFSLSFIHKILSY